MALTIDLPGGLKFSPAHIDRIEQEWDYALVHRLGLRYCESDAAFANGFVLWTPTTD